MKNVKRCFATFLSALGIFWFSSCASLTGYQDGKTIGKDNGEAMISLNISQSPEYSNIEDSFDIEDIPSFIFPNIEVGGRYGVAENLDVTLRVNTNLNLAIGAKYQILGDRSADFAVSLGAEVGTFGLVTGIWNAQIPVYFSYHPSEKVALYASPRYIFQFSTIGGTEGWQYAGGNIGVLFGSRHKLGIDAGLYSVGANGLDRINLITVGIGGKFFFGKEMEIASENRSGKKRRK
ncbi:MAG: hypothetical protein WAU01_13840 [Saprospiraceae bacterium]